MPKKTATKVASKVKPKESKPPAARRAAAAAAAALTSPRITAAQKAEVLIEALPYIQRFWDKNIVIKYGGNSLTEFALQEDFAV